MSRVISASIKAARSPVGMRLAGYLSVLLLSIAGLSACQPETKPPAKTSQVAADETVMAMLERIARNSGIQQAKHEEELRILQPKLNPGSPELMELLLLRGGMSLRSNQEDVFESSLKVLGDWPEGAGKNNAKLAHQLLLARRFLAKGQLAPAKKEMTGFAAYTEANTNITMLLRGHALMSGLMAESGDLDGALSHINIALKLAEKAQKSWRRADLLATLADLYVQAQQVDRAEQTIVDALHEAERDPDPSMMYSIQTMQGIIYAEQGKQKLARKAKLAAVESARTSGAEDLLALALANLADLSLKQGDYATALSLSEEALPLAQSAKDMSTESLARANSGLAKIGLKRVAEGKRDVLASIAFDEKRGANSSAAGTWQELGSYLERAGDLEAAVHAYHQHRKLIDVVLRDDTRKAVLESQAAYDDERRAKDIELLNRDMSLKAEQLRERDLRLKLWAALGGCVLLSGVLLGLAYQRIRNSNRALARSNAALRVQGERDPLTGLSNRRHFQAAIKRLADQGKLSGTVFLIDIDHFKRINDSYGHAAGDSVLVEIAKRLRSTLRDEDLVVRWGGEEFLIVVDTRDADYAGVLAQRLLDSIGCEAVSHGQQSIPITASIGFASFPVAPQSLALSWERAIDLVDTVMYMAKAHGRNKAYGIQAIAADDEASLLLLAARMEAAWHEGSIKLLALHGPEQASASS
ncbi:GGDEF domain-containing protein [Roseateles oligotrophus]|uniref:diguanylate cyclase n=1 Tax=Roseateles oligotrophus TaxID=1769250 RepID=A0ABT2YKQ0_9BURK|nr:GGDEF domain-containing protein [Roseateles oligotrophus]MCV2370633.1 GGDEF domain-containing protein [Roseateles oligotrophus]